VADELRIDHRPELDRPILVAAFRGWNDGAQAASLAAGYLAKTWGAERFAEVEPEGFFDFQATRPHVSLEEGLTRRIDWPETVFYHARPDGLDRDVVLLLGIEPNLRWRTFTDLVVGLARELRIELLITLGALLADVPHSRPVPITGLSSDDALVHRLGLQQSGYEGPTGIVGVLHSACQEAGVPSASLWASVPHYVAAAPNPKAALALVRKLEGLVGVSVDAEELERSAADYERQVSLAVQSDPDVQAFVERLERAAEEEEQELGPQDLPSGDVIAREFQRFLRQRGPGQTD
jgi:predicted ATP-grasp superfamily ATP-dependent carboligase